MFRFIFSLICMLAISGQTVLAATDAKEEVAAGGAVFNTGRMAIGPVRASDAERLQKELFGRPGARVQIEYSAVPADKLAEVMKLVKGMSAEEWQTHVATNVAKLLAAGADGLEATFAEMVQTSITDKSGEATAEWLAANYDIIGDALEDARGNFFWRRNVTSDEDWKTWMEQEHCTKAIADGKTAGDVLAEEKRQRGRFHEVLGQISHGVYAYTLARTQTRVNVWAGKFDKGNPYSMYLGFNKEDPTQLIMASSIGFIDDEGTATVMVLVKPEEQGKHYGTEGLSGMLRYLIDTAEMQMKKVRITTQPGNEAVIEGLLKHGAKKLDDVKEWGALRHVFEISREVLEALPAVEILGGDAEKK